MVLRTTQIAPDDVRIDSVSAWTPSTREEFCRALEEQRIAEYFASGGYGDIYRTLDFESPQAIKVLRWAADPADQQAEDRRLRVAFASRCLEVPQVVWPSTKISINSVNPIPNQVVGLIMPLIPNAIPMERLCQVKYRRRSGWRNPQIKPLLLQVHSIIQSLHNRTILQCDLKPSQFLVTVPGSRVWCIDSESMGYPNSEGVCYTPEYLWSKIAAADGPGLARVAPFSKDSDWYAFAVMVWEMFMLYHPITGGSLPDGHPGAAVPPIQRGLHGISALMKEMVLPGDRMPPQAIGEEAFQYFWELFHGNRSGAFPREILERMEWRKCRGCRGEFVGKSCPRCGADGSDMRRMIEGF